MRPTLLAILAVLACTSCKKEPPATAAAAQPLPAPAAAQAPTPAPGARVITMDVTEDGFVPGNVTVKKDVPLTLQVTRKTDATCATELLIDGTDIHVKLPLNTPVAVAWTPKVAGSVKFGCAMDKMVGGVLLVE